MNEPEMQSSLSLFPLSLSSSSRSSIKQDIEKLRER